MMKYKGYTGVVTYDADAKIFHGDVIGLKDTITFEGTTVQELEQAFKDSIEDYLEFCRDLGRAPQKPFSGKIPLRIDPELHEQLNQKAYSHGMSLNSYIAEQLKKC